ncbi:MAG: hypothetical protein ACR2O7_00940, partial [Parasphingorhabdus sp.]
QSLRTVMSTPMAICTYKLGIFYMLPMAEFYWLCHDQSDFFLLVFNIPFQAHYSRDSAKDYRASQDAQTPIG